ncbi:MAG: D-tyrosyl-tRNA(Tyr) deacylase [Acidimicrobiia bacterium]|nr:D-tyrosyl-tRNA(Tyr) deacylase [Acidimicrobiia bacterium]
MRMVVQRVSRAEVRVEGRVTGSIGRGLLILVGIAKTDTKADAEFLAAKALGLRIFPDAEQRMNLSVVEARGSLLVVSQFTLYGDVRKGRRPAFDRAANPAEARSLYEHFLQMLGGGNIKVESGVFQAMMEVELVNDGPVTILCDSERLI